MPGQLQRYTGTGVAIVGTIGVAILAGWCRSQRLLAEKLAILRASTRKILHVALFLMPDLKEGSDHYEQIQSAYQKADKEFPGVSCKFFRYGNKTHAKDMFLQRLGMPDPSLGFTHCSITICDDFNALKRYMHSEAHKERIIPLLSPLIKGAIVTDTELSVHFDPRFYPAVDSAPIVMFSKLRFQPYVTSGSEVYACLKDIVGQFRKEPGISASLEPVGYAGFNKQEWLKALQSKDMTMGVTHVLTLTVASMERLRDWQASDIYGKWLEAAMPHLVNDGMPAVVVFFAPLMQMVIPAQGKKRSIPNAVATDSFLNEILNAFKSLVSFLKGSTISMAAMLELFGGQKAIDANNGSYDPEKHKVHMLLCALDYPGTSAELTCTQDADNMLELAQQCGVTNITYMKNSECHRSALEKAIREIGGACEKGDYFVFFYAGHGVQLEDQDGDEDDGLDEALCLVTPSGQIERSAFLRDDDFAQIVSSACKQGVQILIMCDCCHSGTIADFNRKCWNGHGALSMSGCRDSQESGDTGKGGIWTHSCLIAVQEMQQKGRNHYSCAQLYNLHLEKDEEVFKSVQDLRMLWTPGLGGPENMAWPLVPKRPYKAPWWKK